MKAREIESQSRLTRSTRASAACNGMPSSSTCSAAPSSAGLGTSKRPSPSGTSSPNLRTRSASLASTLPKRCSSSAAVINSGASGSKGAVTARRRPSSRAASPSDPLRRRSIAARLKPSACRSWISRSRATCSAL